MKKVIVFLSIAVVLGIVSITPLAANWQMLSLGAAAGDGHAFQGVIDAWRGLVDGLQQGQLISSARAYDWRTHGIGVDAFLQTVAMVAVVLAWISAMGVRGATGASGTTTPVQWREAAVGIAQIEHALTNVLLDPQAQSVAEPLNDIAQQLRSVSDALASAPNVRD